MIQESDVLRTLRKELGIARSAVLHRPDSDRNPLWTLAVDIGQTEFVGRLRTGDDYSLSLVGAADIDRADVFARAAGEAVERWALKPSAVAHPRNGQVTAPRGAFWGPLGSAERPVYLGTLHAHGTTTNVCLPAHAVDYPSNVDQDELFDPSPSGTAAAHSIEDAIQRACRELLERDAAMRAWLEGTVVGSVDTDSIGPEAPEFGRLTRVCRNLDLEYAVAYLPTPHARVRPIMAMIGDRSKGVASAGLALGSSDSAAAARALQEALQVRTVLTAREASQRARPPRVIEDDGHRARYWSSQEGLAAGIDWIRGVGPVTAPLITDPDETRWADLVGDYCVVDLSSRLPPAIRNMGWAVAKVFAPRLQPLRMSDALTWNVAKGVEVQVSVPHPFI